MAVSGRVDASTVAEFEARLAGWTRPRALTALVLDMTEMTFIGSRGIRAMWQASRTLDGRSGRFMLCAPHGHVRSLLEMTGFDRIFDLRDSRTAALSSLQVAADANAS